MRKNRIYNINLLCALQGYISLDDPQISRKGYHVPTKGTVQLVSIVLLQLTTAHGNPGPGCSTGGFRV